jgi:tape measure domain-containing protein
MTDTSLVFNLIAKDRASAQLHGVTSKMVAMGAAVGTIAANVAMKVGGMAVDAIKSGLATASAMQQANIGFATLMHSASGAKDFVGKLAKFAAATPFNFPGLVDSARQLMGVGVASKQVIPILTDFGDTAGALGIQQDAFQRIMMATSQALSAGKFQAGDLNQIMMNGMPVWSILAKGMHKTVPELRDLASHGKLLAKDVMPALQAQMHKDYGGAMAKQSQTLGGLWSTLQDTMNLGMANVLTPLVPLLGKVLPAATDALAAGFTWLTGVITRYGPVVISTGAALFKAYGPTVLAVLNKFKDAVSTAFGVTKNMFNFIMGNLSWILPLAGGVTAIAAAWKTYQVAMGIARTAAAAYIAVQSALNFVMAMNPIGLVVLAIVGLAAAFVIAYKRSETFRTVVGTGLGILRGVVAAVVRAILGYYGAMLDAAVWAFGWIPGIGPKLHQAQAEFRTFAAGVNASLAGIHDKTITINVRQGTNTVLTAKGAAGTLFPYPGKARGGPVVRGMAYRVGEEGEETFVPGENGTIVPNGGAAPAMAGTGALASMGGRMVLEVRSGGSALDQVLLEVLRRAVRVSGGNVQTVIGS